MARGPVQRGALGTRDEQLAARAAAIAIITAMLKEGSKTVPELHEAVDALRPTLVSYMGHMHTKLRLIRMTGERRDRSVLWELGADPSLPDPDDELDALIAPKRGIHKAVQIGMRRDWLVAALFGPARGVAA